MPSTLSKPLGIRVPHPQLAQLEALAKLRGASRGAIATEALCRGLDVLSAELDSQVAQFQPLAPPRALRSAAAAAQQEPASEAEPLLRSFAYWVLESARRCQTGRFGEDRVFINHLWRQYRGDQRPKGMTLDSFKLRLLESNRVRLLSLACADMAPLHNQADVKASEICYLSATFHFLCT